MVLTLFAVDVSLTLFLAAGAAYSLKIDLNGFDSMPACSLNRERHLFLHVVDLSADPAVKMHVMRQTGIKPFLIRIDVELLNLSSLCKLR